MKQLREVITVWDELSYNYGSKDCPVRQQVTGFVYYRVLDKKLLEPLYVNDMLFGNLIEVELRDDKS